jgi:hypothetical protein
MKTKLMKVKRAQVSEAVRRMRSKQEDFAVRMGYTSVQNMLTRISRNDLTEKHLAFVMKGTANNFYPVYLNTEKGYTFQIFKIGSDKPALEVAPHYDTLKEARGDAEKFVIEYERVIE